MINFWAIPEKLPSTKPYKSGKAVGPPKIVCLSVPADVQNQLQKSSRNWRRVCTKFKSDIEPPDWIISTNILYQFNRHKEIPNKSHTLSELSIDSFQMLIIILDIRNTFCFSVAWSHRSTIMTSCAIEVCECWAVLCVVNFQILTKIALKSFEQFQILRVQGVLWWHR